MSYFTRATQHLNKGNYIVTNFNFHLSKLDTKLSANQNRRFYYTKPFVRIYTQNISYVYTHRTFRTYIHTEHFVHSTSGKHRLLGRSWSASKIRNREIHIDTQSMFCQIFGKLLLRQNFQNVDKSTNSEILLLENSFSRIVGICVVGPEYRL
jgi:hypothetical protein